MKNFYKTIVITFMILLISILHLRAGHADLAVHVLHRELFFIPIILAGLWFGIRVGLGVVTLVCLIYTPLVLHHGFSISDSDFPQIIAQLMMYLVIGGLIGWLSDQWRCQQKDLLQSERLASLSKAASTLGFEIKDVVYNLQNVYSRAGGLIDSTQEKSFQQELDRLNNLIGVLDEYKPIEKHVTLYEDLNLMLESCYKQFRKRAKSDGVKIDLNLDPIGCPTMIDGGLLMNTICSLVDNAFDVSKRGDTIVLASEKMENECILSVLDEGPGVLAKDLPKLFSPFFTTKPNGSGLGLSAGRKVLREQGGDLFFTPISSGGAKFSIVVPRENTEYNLDEYLISQNLVNQEGR